MTVSARASRSPERRSWTMRGGSAGFSRNVEASGRKPAAAENSPTAHSDGGSSRSRKSVSSVARSSASAPSRQSR